MRNEKYLVLNLGSSSIKFSLFTVHGKNYHLLANGLFDKIGQEGCRVECEINGNKQVLDKFFPDHKTGITFLKDLLTKEEYCAVIKDTAEIGAIGHRVVHGGDKVWRPCLIDQEVIDVIEEYSRFAPLHNPINLLGIREAGKAFPNVPQVAVFDTAFHHTIPTEVRVYGLPFEYFLQGVKKYGFHGTSHHYISLKAAELMGLAPDEVNFITCHLGNGSSITAVEKGRSIDTSMGFTPLEGLMMGTRCGDIDPAAVFYVMRKRGLTAEQMEGILNKKSGVYGIAGIDSYDMRDIRAAANDGNEQAQLALQAFAHRVGAYIGRYGWHLKGDYHIVFTAGIGENEWRLRNTILEGQEKNGIVLDEEANRTNSTFITTEDSPRKVLVVHTDEELMIARYAHRIITE